MFTLETASIRLGASANDKADAIRQVGQLLLDTGKIHEGYIASMMKREEVTATFLGNGIAIPHGMRDDGDLIRETGLAVVQFPNGVEWNPGETVHVAVGIAARSDEHIRILANLTNVVMDEAAASRLACTRDAGEVAATLNGADAAPGPEASTGDFSHYAEQREFRITGAAGLHARPAAAFVDVAKPFDADVRVRCGERTANGKSLASLLNLGVEQGGSIRVLVDGSDAEAAMKAIAHAIEAGLEEEAESIARTQQAAPQPTLTAAERYGATALQGVAAAPGVALGAARVVAEQRFQVARDAADPKTAGKELDAAILAAQEQLEALQTEAEERLGGNEAKIFQAHRELLEDPEVLEQARDHITAGRSAAYAFRSAAEQTARTLEGLDNPLLAARATDLRDVSNRMLRLLCGAAQDTPAPATGPVIVVADDLTPSDTFGLSPDNTLAICTARGGPNSHTAILARSLDIPAVVALGDALEKIGEGDELIADGDCGALLIRPDEQARQTALEARRAYGQRRAAEKEAAYQPAITLDAHRVEVVANIGSAEEALQAVQSGAEGVGLLRTEFLFLGREEPPSEEEQYQAYRSMLEALNGLPLIVRTLDIGGDKVIPYLNLPAEDNPFLGVRGIRLCFRYPELFRTQLRAVLRAARHGPLKIMFPMVSNVAELRRARAMVLETAGELDAPRVEIGIMVEVPSAALLADRLAEEADFFSVGSNDLTQYVLAMDRMHPTLATEADDLHPAVLRLIDQVVRAAHARGRWVGVCGGLASDPVAVPLLLGLGVDELSATVASVASIKARCRAVALVDCRAAAERALGFSTATEVRTLAAEL